MEPPAKQQKIDHTPDVHTISLIWLDDSNQTSEENLAAQQQLRVFDPDLKLFQNDTECEDYIKTQSDQSQIVLIVNGRLGQQIVPRVQNLTQLVSIYVYCLNKEFHEKWAKEITKVKDVVIQFTELKDQIHRNHFSHISTDVNPSIDNHQRTTGIYELDKQYLLSDICMDYLSQMEATSDERDAFTVLYRTIFAGQTERMALVQIFQESYSPERALSWFQKDPFFQQILETIFQKADLTTMHLCRFFIRDIRQQFEQNKCTSSILVYRGQTMSNENLQELKNLEGKIMAIKSFFSTTVNRDIAMMFISEANEHKRVLFKIEANSEIEGVKSFIKMGPLLDQIDNEEVLFMLGSLFKIDEIRDDDENGITIINMTLCANENGNTMKSQLNAMNEGKDLIGFAQLQYELSQLLVYPELLNNMDEFLQKYLVELLDDHSDRLRCYDLLKLITLATGDWNSSIHWCEKSLEIRKQILPSNDPKLAVYYDILACAYLKKGENIQALNALKQILMICKQMFGDDHTDLVPCYLRIIEIYELQEQFTDVLLCYNQVYNILLKRFAIDDVNLAPIYNNMGKTFASLAQYPLALGYYQTSLNIKLKHLPPASDSLALTYRSIAFVYKFMGDIDQARIHFQKAAAIYRELHSATDEIVLEIEQLIENLSSPL